MTALAVLYDAIRWEEKALLKASQDGGAPVNMVDCRKLRLDLDRKTEFDTVIQRCVSYYRNLHSTAALEGMGAVVINKKETAILAGNKLFTHMLLNRAGVPTPRAHVAFSAESALDMMEETGYPRILKPTVGSWGRMVSRANDAQGASAIISGRERMHPVYHIHYMEEFVSRPPRDIRAIVIGDEVVAAIYRYSANDEWKTNMALGGRAEVCPVTPEMQELCARSREAVQGDIVGVDLMEGDGGLVVHEVNNTTEYKNTVRVCQVDIPAKIIEYARGLRR